VSPAADRTVLGDVDEVLFPFAHGYDAWLTAHRGRGLDPDLMREYLIAEAAGDGHRDYAVQFVNDPAALDIPPVPGATAAIAALGERYRLVACTSRRNLHEGPATRAWLDRHLPGFDDVVCTSESHDGVTVAKGSVAAHRQAVALIDDSAEHLTDLPDGCRGFLLRRPEGLASGPSAVTWPDVVATLLD
jgi:hypothetical protein